MIKTVLFDLGNVILPFDLMRLANRLATYSPYTPEEILQKIAYTKMAEDFETGRMSPEDYYAYVTQSCAFKNLPFQEFVSIFNDIFDEDPNIVDLIKTLKQNYQLGLISNTNPIHVDYLRSAFPNLRHFQHIWFSNEAGVRKPHPHIFEMALNTFQSEPHETVFIDDYEENVQGARDLGIQALQYKGIDQLKNELRELGVQH